MEIEERLIKLHEHVQEHPRDYQSVIAELKLHSAYIDKTRKQALNARLRQVAEIRKRRREHEESEQ